jgi:thiol:disulfide interchange protein DsbA
MKQLFALFVVMLTLAACSQEQEPGEPVADEAAVEAEATGTVAEEAVDAAEEVTKETQEVVEESAAVEEEAGDEAIVLAIADTSEPAREWKFKEGTHYARLVPTQPTVGGAGKIEVSEVFNYTCPHCYDLDPILNKWVADLPPEVRFVRIPGMFNRVAELHAQMYYTAELLAADGTLPDMGQFHSTVFDEFHRRGNRLLAVDSIERLFARFGVSADDFNKTWNSFPVNQKMRVAADLGRRYGVALTGVPVIIINGKYRVPNVSNKQELLDIIEELLAREGLR